MNKREIIATLMGVLLMGILGFNTFINTGTRSDIRLVSEKISKVDERIIAHQSNHELHIPRGEAVTQAEFDMHVLASNMSYDRIRDIVKGLKDFIIANNKKGEI